MHDLLPGGVGRLRFWRLQYPSRLLFCSRLGTRISARSLRAHQNPFLARWRLQTLRHFRSRGSDPKMKNNAAIAPIVWIIVDISTLLSLA